MPQLGFALGAIAGSVLFPTQLPAGPQLKDGRTTTANIGTPIPIIFGTASVAGQVIWLAPYVASQNEAGGKGGPEQLQYTYTQSIAIALCESPIDGQTAIGGILRIWENGTIVYDIRTQQPADTALGYAAETDQEYANRLTASEAYALTFTLYLGSEDQMPDPTIEATQGVGNVPAFRGLAYIVYPNRLLQTTQAWRHPNFIFEVYQSGTGECQDTTAASPWVLYPWNPPTAQDPRNDLGTYQYLADYTAGSTYATIEEAFTATGIKYAYCYGWSAPYSSGINSGWLFPGQPLHATPVGEAISVAMWFNQNKHSSILNKIAPTTDGYGICGMVGPEADSVWFTGGYYFGSSAVCFPHGICYAFPEGTVPTDPVHASSSEGSSWVHIGSCSSGNQIWTYADQWIAAVRVPGKPIPICHNLPAAPITGYCVLPDGRWQLNAEWVLDTTKEYLWLANYDARSTQVTQYPLGPALAVDEASNNETFWTAAYNEAVRAGTIPAGLVYGRDYPVNPNYNGANPGTWTIDSEVCEGSSGGATLDQIILALCSRANLDAAQVDVADMASIPCDGYAICSVSNAADCIAPLRSIGFFDAIESGSVLRFQSRGKPIVATLTPDQIGAYDGSSTSNVPPSVSVKRTQDVDLPRQIRLHYKAVSRDYQDGEQDSPFRLVTKAVNDQDIELPMCLGDTQALQAAQVLWADAWAGRNEYTTSVDQALSELEVGDPIAIPDNGLTQRVRIIADSVSSGVLRKLTCVSDDSAAYVSVAVADEPYAGSQRMVIIQQSQYVLMDLPALQDADSNAGFYVAAWPIVAGGNMWKGTQIYSSIDGGSTWTQQFALTLKTDNGTLDDAVPASPYFTWDDATVIVVNSAANVSFQSRTDDAVLAGANGAAIGADGRWEIVQFANATQISSTTWHLSRLLRGRRGTEHNIGTSQAGDAFVMLSENSLNRIILQNTQIGSALSYDGVSIGASFGTGGEQTFTGRGMALKPFSPVDVRMERQSDGDVLISWTRRDRLNGTLMSGVDMPLSDPPLSFSIDILDDLTTAPTVIRTLASSTTSVLYTAAMQSADAVDLGSPHHFGCAVYQISQVVGRGFPGYGSYSG
jgi:hypothetical protein